MSQFCISCGAENQDEAKFCKSCGEKLITEEAEKFKQEEQKLAEEEKYKSFGGWLIFYAVLLVLGNITSLGYFAKAFVGDEFSMTYETIYTAGMTETASYLSWMITVELIAYFFFLLFTINFFMKSPITKSLMIIYAITTITSVVISIFLLYKIDSNMSGSFADIFKMIISSIFVIIWMFYFIFSKRVKKTFVAQDGNEPENSLVITIVFAMLIPAYFGYQHYNTVSSLKSISNDTYALTEKAIELQDDKKYEEAIEAGLKKSSTTKEVKSIEDYKNWEYKEWKINTLDNMVRYSTHGTNVWGDTFGFINKKESCENNLLYFYISTYNELPKKYIDKNVQFSVTIDEAIFSIDIPLVNSYSEFANMNIALFSNFIANKNFIELLKRGSSISISIVGPKEILEHFDKKEEKYNLNGFTATHLKSYAICEKAL